MAEENINLTEEEETNLASIQKKLFGEEEAKPQNSTQPSNEIQEPLSKSLQKTEQEVLGNNKLNMVIQAPLSFRDKLLQTVNPETPSAMMMEEGISIEAEDYRVAIDGFVPSITFSQRVNGIMAEYMRYAVVVKILGRFVRQKALYTKIVSLYHPFQAYRAGGRMFYGETY